MKLWSLLNAQSVIREIQNREVEPAITPELIDGRCSTQTKPDNKLLQLQADILNHALLRKAKNADFSVLIFFL